MDGQILVNTGILPLKNGASCFRFPHNRYPSISELYNNAAILVPGGPSVWNQVAISKSCGIDTNYTVSFNDADIFHKYEEIMNEHDFVMVLTSSSHSPFRQYADSSDLVLPVAMPEVMRNYLKTINFMDRYLGHALQKIDESDELRDAVVVITGDHTIFSQNFREEFYSYCQSSGELQYKVNEAYCPLIVSTGGGGMRYSHKSEDAFQMDIYPTILHAIGCDSFFWEGWGENLFDSIACENRTIQEDEAIEMADKLIRSNWFENYQN
jgi:membrane-anchored protein YejM (alkaline phosphatase superfamily)